MTSDDIIHRLLDEGWALSHGKGSHQKLCRPERGCAVTVPHPRKDLAIGTLRHIYRQAGWTWRE